MQNLQYVLKWIMKKAKKITDLQFRQPCFMQTGWEQFQFRYDNNLKIILNMNVLDGSGASILVEIINKQQSCFFHKLLLMFFHILYVDVFELEKVLFK